MYHDPWMLQRERVEKIRKLEASELEITLNPKISQYNLKSKIYPKGRSTLGMPGTKVNKKRKK